MNRIFYQGFIINKNGIYSANGEKVETLADNELQTFEEARRFVDGNIKLLTDRAKKAEAARTKHLLATFIADTLKEKPAAKALERLRAIGLSDEEILRGGYVHASLVHTEVLVDYLVGKVLEAAVTLAKQETFYIQPSMVELFYLGGGLVPQLGVVTPELMSALCESLRKAEMVLRAKIRENDVIELTLDPAFCTNIQ